MKTSTSNQLCGCLMLIFLICSCRKSNEKNCRPTDTRCDFSFLVIIKRTLARFVGMVMQGKELNTEMYLLNNNYAMQREKERNS